MKQSPAITDDRVERVARALAIADGKDPDAPAWARQPGNETFGICWRDQYVTKAKAAIEALQPPATWQEAVTVLARELEAAGGIFRAYEALHLEKGTEDGRQKAKRNAGFAESIERTLAKYAAMPLPQAPEVSHD